MKNIFEDFPNIGDEDFLYIAPLCRLNVKKKFKLNNIVIYPQGSIDLNEIFANHYFLNEDPLQDLNIYKENSLVVFCEKPPVEFSAQAANNFEILNFALNYLSSILDYIIFQYCDINNNKILPGRIGQIVSGETTLILYAGIGSPKTRIIREKISTNTITIGNGLFINNLEILNSYTLLNPDIAEVGNIAKHALRMYVEMLETNSLTDKFIHIMRLFEFIAAPNDYEKFQNVKTKILAHVAKNRNEIHDISDDFKYYSSGNNNDGLRTQIIHNGKKIESLVSNDVENIFEKLHRYLHICINDLLLNYNKDWAFLEELRVTKRKSAEMIKEEEEDNSINSSALVLIDCVYLQEAINTYHKLYKEVYPSKKLDSIDLKTLFYEILLNTRKWEENKIYSFYLFHTEATSLPYMHEIFDNLNNRVVTHNNSSFLIYTFQNTNQESLIYSMNRKLNSLSIINPINTEQLNSFDCIVVCGESELYKEVLNTITRNSKEVILIIDAHLSEMGNCGLPYFDIGHLIGKALGLKQKEL